MSYIFKDELEIEGQANPYLVIKISPDFLRVDLSDVVELMKAAGYEVFSPTDMRYCSVCPMCAGG